MQRGQTKTGVPGDRTKPAAPDGRTKAAASDSRWIVWALAVTLAYGVVWVASFARSPNWDEVWLLGNTFSPLAEQMKAIRNDMAHPPGPYLVFRGWFAVFGATELSARALSGLVAIATLILYARLAFRRVAYPAIAILGFSALYLRIGSVATLFRGYGMLLLAVVVCVTCWDQWNRTGKATWLTGVAVAATVAVYSHYFGVLLAVALGACELVARRRLLAFVALAAPAILLLPWLAVVLPEYLARGDSVPTSLSWANNYGLGHGILELPGAFLAGAEAGNDPYGYALLRENVRVASWLRILSWSLLGSLGILGMARWRPWPPPTTETPASQRFEHFFWVAFPGLALLAVSAAAQPLLHPRFLVGAWPIGWLLLADLAAAGGRPARVLASSAATIALVAAAVTTSRQLNPSPLRAATTEVARSWSAGDLLLADTPIAAHVFWEWRAVQHREDRVWAVRAGPNDESPPRELRGQNVLPYRDLSTVQDAHAARIWAFCSQPEHCDRIVRELSRWGYRPTRSLGSSAGRLPFEVDLFESDAHETTGAGDTQETTGARKE